MKNLFTILFVLASIAGYSQKATNTWNGSFNSYWHNNNNWSLGHIPTATEDVVIPNGMSRYPSVDYNDEEINSLTIQSAAEVRIYDNYLNVSSYVEVSGQIKMMHTDAELHCGDISWNSGSSAETTGECKFYVYGLWEFAPGADVQLSHGYVIFTGSGNSYIRSKEADCYFREVRVNKSGGKFALSAQSTASCIIKNNLYLHNSNYDVFCYADETIQIGDALHNASSTINVQLDNGTIEFTGSNSTASTCRLQDGNYLNNLIINSGDNDTDMSTIYTSTTIIKGDLTINSGRLDVNGMDLIVGGDWENNVGSSGFNERTRKVTFNGNTQQYCSDETFYTLEVNKSAYALRMNGSDVVCAEYDWTDGAIDVLSGSFTANELLDNGIAGEWYVNDEVHIHQNVGYIDLLGDLHIFDGGYMHVYGGSGDSWWPYGASGSHFEIESGGALKFHDVGINIRPTGNLTTDITGGWIGMAGNFKVDRADFSDPAAIWAMQGLTDTQVEILQGQIYQLDIDKLTGKTSGEALYKQKNGSGHTLESPLVYDSQQYGNNNYVSTGIYTTGFTDREGKPHSPARSNTVSVAAIFGLQNIDIYGGTLDLNGQTANISGDIFVLDGGILKMVNPLDVLNVKNMEWWSGSADLITKGEIKVSGNWTFKNGAEAQLDSGNVVRFIGGGLSSIYNYDADAFFGSIALQKNTGSSVYLNELSTYPIYCIGGFFIENNNNFYPQTETLIVDGTLEIQNGSAIYLEDAGGQLINNSKLHLTGKIEVMDGCEALINGAFQIAPNGELIIGGGTFILASSTWSGIYGSLSLSDGLLDFRNSIIVGEYASTAISGGVIKVDHTFSAQFSGTFEPTGGTVEFYNESQSVILCNNGNFFYNLDINVNGDVELLADLLVAHDLNINSGTFDVSDQIVEVGNDVNIYGMLTMTNSSGELECGNRVTWMPGSNDDITAGNIFSNYWTFEEGTNAMLGTGNTVHLSGGNSPYDPNAEFGNLVIGTWSKSGESMQTHPGSHAGKTHLSVEGLNVNAIKDGKTLYPRRVAGNCTYLPGIAWNSPMDIIVHGTLDIQDGASQDLTSDNTIYTYSDFDLYGTLDLRDEGNGHVEGDFDVLHTGDLIIEGGQFTVISDVWTSIYGSLTMTAGVLELQNSLDIKASADVNISGGTIRIEYILDAREPNTFQPAGGTVEFFGNFDGGFYCNNGNFLYNLKINKAPSHGVYVGLNTHVLNNLIIDGGIFKVKYSDNPKNIELGGDVDVNEGGVLWFDEYVNVIMADGSNINVNDGGTLQFSGLPDGNVLLTSTAGTYNFNIWPGGEMAAEYTTFEKMTADGILFHTGSMIDPASPFSHCTFQAGAPGGTMLTMNNDQEVTMEEVSFYSDGFETYNVTKTNDHGSITFVDFNGDFAGAEYENDPYNRIHWFEPELSVTPSALNVPANAATALLNLEANVAWQITNTFDWLTINPMSGTGDNTLVIDFVANTSLDSRTAICVVSGEDVPDVEFTITQAGMDPVLSVTPANQDVSAAAGTTTFDVTSNTSWSVSESVGWLSVSPMNGNNNNTLTVTFDENTSINERVGEITISAAGVSDVVVTVTQAGTAPVLSVTPANQDVSAAAGTTTFNLVSNTSWTVSEGLGWLSVAPAYGEGDFTLLANYIENTSIFPRSGNITISADGVEDVIVTVSQAGADVVLEATPANRNVSAAAGTTTFDLISNVTWSVSESLGWLSVNPAAGSNNASLTVDYTENTSVASRTGSITISASGTPDVIVTVTQAGVNNELSVSPSNQQVGIMPGTTTFDIMSNTSWSVTESVIWLSTNIQDGTGNAVLEVSYQGNYSTIDRVGEVTITTDSKLAVTVTVTQPGITPTLAVDPEALFFLSPNGIGFLNVYSNTNWTITDNMDWLGLNLEFPSGNQVVTVSVQMNFTGMERSGEITVETEDGSTQIIVPVTQGYFVEHVISLPAGWSGLSSYASPTPPFIEDVFSGISDELIIALTEEEIYYPEYGINTIGMWEGFSGYKIKTDAAVDLEIYGSSYPVKTMDVPAGWSLLPVISECPVDVEDLFALVVSDIEIVKDVAGYGIYWPDMGINTLGTLNPGKAYYVLSNAVVEITFDDCSKTVTSETLSGFGTLTELSSWKIAKPSASSHSIALLPGAIQNFEKESIIGAFDTQGNCFGATVLNGNANVITIFGDDELTTEKDGFANEDEIIFKLYQPSAKEEMELLPDFDFTLPDADGLFTENGLSAITGFKGSTGTSETISLQCVNIYPNPSSGKIFIEDFVPGSTITIMDMHGQQVFEKTLHENDVQQIGLEHLDPGAYMVIIKNSLNTSSHKLILN